MGPCQMQSSEMELFSGEKPHRGPRVPVVETDPAAVRAEAERIMRTYFASVLLELCENKEVANPRISSRNACEGQVVFANIEIKDASIRRQLTRKMRDKLATPPPPKRLSWIEKLHIRHKPKKPAIKKQWLLECALVCRCWVKLLNGMTFVACLCGLNRDPDNVFVQFRHIYPVDVDHPSPTFLGALFCIPLRAVADLSTAPFLELELSL